jgi:decaprenyl-phosphate phosphoribosyltransferase
VHAFVLAALLVAAAVALFTAAALPRSVGVVTLIYVAINISYTLGLKRVGLLELFMVASGFVLRVLAGGFALRIIPSSWLLAMTGVIAMLIVTAKRRGEIAEGHAPSRGALRAYNMSFLDSLISMLAGMTIVFYLLFAMSEYGTGRYGEPALLLAAPVLAYGVLRFVQIANVSKGVDDPTQLIVTDGGLLLSMLIFASVFAVILYGG